MLLHAETKPNMSHWCTLCCTKNHTGHFINEYSGEHTYKKGRLHWQWTLCTLHCTDAWSIKVKQKAFQTWRVINGYSSKRKAEAPLHWQQLLHKAQVCVLLMLVETIIQKRQMDRLNLPQHVYWDMHAAATKQREFPLMKKTLCSSQQPTHMISRLRLSILVIHG